MTRTHRSQSGQAVVLALGLTMAVLAVAGLAVDGTRAFLLRRTLQNAADGAALAASGELDRAAFYRSGGREVSLDPAAARAEAVALLAERSIRADVAIETAGDGVDIILRADSATTFLRLVGIDAVPVAASARAVPVGGPPGS